MLAYLCQDLVIFVHATQLLIYYVHVLLLIYFRRKKLLKELKLNKNPKVTNSLLTFCWQIRYSVVCIQDNWPIGLGLIPVFVT